MHHGPFDFSLAHAGDILELNQEKNRGDGVPLSPIRLSPTGFRFFCKRHPARVSHSLLGFPTRNSPFLPGFLLRFPHQTYPTMGSPTKPVPIRGSPPGLFSQGFPCQSFPACQGFSTVNFLQGVPQTRFSMQPPPTTTRY